MKTLAYALDISLFVLFLLTITLIAYKALDLLKPQWMGKSPLVQRLQGSRSRISVEMEKLESWMAVLAVIASAAPFVGLVGTVMHIIEALRNMSQAGVDMTLISGPIATALNATLVGLASAIPAAIAHALFARRLQVLENRALRTATED